MDVSGGDGRQPVYGGRRRSRIDTAARSRPARAEGAVPVIEPAVRYFPPTAADLDEATTPRRSPLPPPPKAPAREAVVVAPVTPHRTAAPREHTGSSSVDWAGWSRDRPGERPRRPLAARLVPLWIGLLSTVLSLVGMWLVPLAMNETELIMAAGLGLDEFRTYVGTGHAGQALWVAVLHAWIQLVGDAPAALRVLPALCIGAASAGVTVLGTRVADLRGGILAGLVFALLPRAVYQGGEVTGVALGLALGVWATVLLVGSVDANDPIPQFRVERWLVAPTDLRRRRSAIVRHVGRWSLYTLVLTLAIFAFPPSVALVAVHPIAMYLGTTARRALRSLGVALVVTVLLALPLLASTIGDAIGAEERRTAPHLRLLDILLLPVTTSGTLSAVLMGVVVGGALALAILCRRRTGRAFGTRTLWLGWIWLTVLAAGAVISSVAFDIGIGASLLCFMAPGFALLLGPTLAALDRRVAWSALGLYAAIAAVDIALLRIPT